MGVNLRLVESVPKHQLVRCSLGEGGRCEISLAWGASPHGRYEKKPRVTRRRPRLSDYWDGLHAKEIEQQSAHERTAQ